MLNGLHWRQNSVIKAVACVLEACSCHHAIFMKLLFDCGECVSHPSRKDKTSLKVERKTYIQYTIPKMGASLMCTNCSYLWLKSFASKCAMFFGMFVWHSHLPTYIVHYRCLQWRQNVLQVLISQEKFPSLSTSGKQEGKKRTASKRDRGRETNRPAFSC